MGEVYTGEGQGCKPAGIFDKIIPGVISPLAPGRSGLAPPDRTVRIKAKHVMTHNGAEGRRAAMSATS